MGKNNNLLGFEPTKAARALHVNPKQKYDRLTTDWANKHDMKKRHFNILPLVSMSTRDRSHESTRAHKQDVVGWSSTVLISTIVPNDGQRAPLTQYK